jgi:hypothetical protein
MDPEGHIREMELTIEELESRLDNQDQRLQAFGGRATTYARCSTIRLATARTRFPLATAGTLTNKAQPGIFSSVLAHCGPGENPSRCRRRSSRILDRPVPRCGCRLRFTHRTN